MGKKFSVLGDSISTLEGYNPPGYSLFFQGEKCKKAKVFTREDTWWGQVIDFFGGELLVNNSWSGSRVTRLPNSFELFPSGCSDERTNGLHIGNVTPDIIIVYMGTNDWGFGVKPEPDFSQAYDNMLNKLRNNYPEAEIWCCTLSATYVSAIPKFVFPYSCGGFHMDLYNNIIRDLVSRHNCRLIDLAGHNEPYDSIDGSHPNARGMKTLASVMIKEMLWEYL